MVQDKRLIAIVNGNSSFGNQLDGRREGDFFKVLLDQTVTVQWLG